MSKPRAYTRLAGLVALMSFVMVVGAVAPSSASNARYVSTRGDAPEFDAEPETATSAPSITIVEDAVPNAAQDFPFTGCQGVSCGLFALDDDADSAPPNTVSASGLAAGTYTITQAPGVNHWILDDIFCDTGEDVDVENRTVTITLGAAEDVTCTFLNRSPSIQITEDATPDAAQDFSFTGCGGSGCGEFVLDDDNDPTLPNSITASGLAPGTYTVTQSLTSGGPLYALSCNTGESVDLINRRATITLGATEFARCTFTNRLTGIKIVQDTVPDGPQDFSFTGCQGSGCAPFVLDDDSDSTVPNSISAAGLADGTYTITQLPTDSFDLLSLECDSYANIDLVNQRVTISLSGDRVVTCTFTNRPTPAPIPDIAQISAGVYHTCARLTNGEARCWGRNSSGELGDGTTTDRVWPTIVSNSDGTGPLTGVAQLTAGMQHTCALLTSGEVRCWGTNGAGGLGDGTTTGRTRPVVVLNPAGTGPLTGVAEIAAGWDHTCARLTNGEARCWGWNSSGELGDGTTSDRTRPVVVSNPAGSGALTDVGQITVGSFHSCVRLINGEARCWGWNYQGALGDGTNYTRSRPVVVLNPAGTGPLTGVSTVSAGWGHTCARLTRQVRCWGYNEFGALGDATVTSRSLPVVVVDPLGDGPLTNVAEVDVGNDHTCVRLINTEARCWGYGGNLQMGDGNRNSFVTRPVTVLNEAGTGPLTHIIQISAGNDHTCALLDSRQARCWGSNRFGQVGDGTTVERPRPVTVVSP